MIPIDKGLILELHKLSINRFGGQHGLRDSKLLDSAVMRHLQLLMELIYILQI